MTSISRSRVAKHKGLLPFYLLLCPLLAFMIFAWGTSYKVSLYRASSNSVPAKACMRGSEDALSAIGQAAKSDLAAPADLLMTAYGVADYDASVGLPGRAGSQAVSDLSPFRRAPILHLRPPPSSVPTLD